MKEASAKQGRDHHRKKVGLALGGGGARGIAHIGVIKGLIEAGVAIDYIAGTSMGALVGGVYALTKDIYALENTFLDLKRKDVLPLRDVFGKKRGSLFRHDAIVKMLEEAVSNRNMEECEIPFRAVATDVRNGEEVDIKSGRLKHAIHASIALPVIFAPVEHEGRLLMDGGFSNPVPADLVRVMGAEYVIAVDVTSKWINFENTVTTISSVYDAMSNAFSAMEYQLSRHVLEKADVVLRPPVVNYGWMQFDKACELSDLGKDELRLHLGEIRKGTGYPEPPKSPLDSFIDFLFRN